MSHLVTIHTKIRDPLAVAAACARLGLPAPVHGTARLYSGEASGLLVQLPGWQYPVVIDTATGTVHFDNFNEHWGQQAQLDRFVQMYAVEKCRLEARKDGRVVAETQLQDGSIRLQILESQ